MPTTGSSVSQGSQGFKAARIAAWSLVPPTLRPETGALHSLEHFTIFVATGFAFGLGYKRRHDLLAILLVIFSGAIEIAQLFVQGRHARLGDFIIDAVAACIGLVWHRFLV
jgi:VanZ family protein